MTGPRAVLVTGGGTGIGAAVAGRLTAAGDQVAILGRRPDVLAAVAARTGALAVPPWLSALRRRRAGPRTGTRLAARRPRR